ncbi:MAG: lamin tail domain-containing protein [Bacteroidaceae bacterium]
MKNFCFTIVAICGMMLLAGCEVSPKGGVVLNEICGKDNDGLEWIEVGNTSNEPINLKGYKVRKMDVEGLEKKVYEFPEVVLAPGEIYTINTEDLKAHIPYKKAIIIELENAEGDVVDSFDSDEDLNLECHPIGGSYARVPNLKGEWTLVKQASWNEPNPSAVADDDLDEFEVDNEE